MIGEEGMFRLVSGGELAINLDGKLEISKFQLQRGNSPVETFSSQPVCLERVPELIRIEIDERGIVKGPKRSSV